MDFSMKDPNATFAVYYLENNDIEGVLKYKTVTANASATDVSGNILTLTSPWDGPNISTAVIFSQNDFGNLMLKTRESTRYSQISNNTLKAWNTSKKTMAILGIWSKSTLDSTL